MKRNVYLPYLISTHNFKAYDRIVKEFLEKVVYGETLVLVVNNSLHEVKTGFLSKKLFLQLTDILCMVRDHLIVLEKQLMKPWFQAIQKEAYAIYYYASYILLEPGCYSISMRKRLRIHRPPIALSGISLSVDCGSVQFIFPKSYHKMRLFNL